MKYHIKIYNIANAEHLDYVRDQKNRKLVAVFDTRNSAVHVSNWLNAANNGKLYRPVIVEAN